MSNVNKADKKTLIIKRIKPTKIKFLKLFLINGKNSLSKFEQNPVIRKNAGIKKGDMKEDIVSIYTPPVQFHIKVRQLEYVTLLQ